FDPFKMLCALLDAGRDGLQIKQRAPAGWAGHVIGLEAAAARRLQYVVCQPQALSPPGFAAYQYRVANAVGQERADDDGGAQKGDLRLQGDGLQAQAIFEQDRVVAAQALELR